jgi:hypothetical protein
MESRRDINYNTLVDVVGKRVTNQRFNDKDLSIESALEDYELTAEETMVIVPYITEVYKRAAVEKKEEDEYWEKAGKYKTLPGLISLIGSFYVGVLVNYLTKNPWLGLIALAATLHINEKIEKKYRYLTSLFSGTKRRTEGEAIFGDGLKKKTVKALKEMRG